MQEHLGPERQKLHAEDGTLGKQKKFNFLDASGLALQTLDFLSPDLLVHNINSYVFKLRFIRVMIQMSESNPF